MPEISEDQIAFLDQFASMLTDSIDWGSAPETMKEDYTTFQQIIDSLKTSGSPQQQQDSQGGPLGGAVAAGEIPMEDMAKMRDMAASMVKMMDDMMGMKQEAPMPAQ